jgi:predicted methyltransferase
MADDRPNQKGLNTKKKQKCRNCEGKGLLARPIAATFFEEKVDLIKKMLDTGGT